MKSLKFCHILVYATLLWLSLQNGIKYIWAVTCDLKQGGILTRVDSDEPMQPHLKLRNSKWCSVSSLTGIEYSSNCKGSDQTACMPRLIWGFAGRTYHINGNLMQRLICHVIFFIHSTFDNLPKLDLLQDLNTGAMTKESISNAY